MKKKLAIIAGALFLAAGAVNFAYSQTQKMEKVEITVTIKGCIGKDKRCNDKGAEGTYVEMTIEK